LPLWSALTAVIESEASGKKTLPLFNQTFRNLKILMSVLKCDRCMKKEPTPDIDFLAFV
jgi:hypothetical protein